MTIQIQPEAIYDIADLEEYFEQKSSGLGSKFLADLEDLKS
jgi:hypothetical protein